MSRLYKGIDISLYQGNVDFAAVRGAGIDFVMFKASQGRTADYDHPFADPKFRTNVERFARTPGRIYGGAYHYLMARNAEEARNEADFFINTVKPYRRQLALWSAVDVEDATLNMNADALTQVVKIFCDRVRAAGLRPMVYSSSWWLKNRFTVPAGVPVWEANWSVSAVPKGARMWQKGTGSVPGIAGEVDIDYAYDIMGDADGDGKVSAKDVTAVMRHMLHQKGTQIDEAQADFDRNGRINARDVISLMRAIVG